MEPRSITLTLTLALVLSLSAAARPSFSPSPSPSLSPSKPLFRYPPKQLNSDPATLRPATPASFINIPPPHLRHWCPPDRPNCLPSSGSSPPGTKRKLNFGQTMGLVLAGIAVSLQVVLGGFLFFKRRQFRKTALRERRNVASSSALSS